MVGRCCCAAPNQAKRQLCPTEKRLMRCWFLDWHFVRHKLQPLPSHPGSLMVSHSKTPISMVSPEQIEQAVLLIRGQRVMLDRDLAALYGVTTSNLNKAVKRNLDRFPADFMFQLALDEAQAVAGSRFQIGILKQGQNIKYLPYAFTQEGVAMLSSVLRSPRAVQVNIAIMRVFVRLRETLALHKDLAQKLAQLERK